MTRLDPKKIALSGFVLVAFAAYSISVRGGDDSPAKATSKTTASSRASSSAPAQRTPASRTAASYKDGQYVGPVTDAVYGDLQIQVTIQGGRIVSVDFLQYPNDRPESTGINQQAIPFLQQEAIKAQSAHVDSITGATDTSRAFEQSLAAALNIAM